MDVIYRGTILISVCIIDIDINPERKLLQLFLRWKGEGYTTVQFCLPGYRISGVKPFSRYQWGIIFRLLCFTQVGAVLMIPLWGNICYWRNLELLTHHNDNKQVDFQSDLLLFLIFPQQSTSYCLYRRLTSPVVVRGEPVILLISWNMDYLKSQEFTFPSSLSDF